MLAKVCVGLLAVAALSYGGAAVYVGGCPFSALCHSHCDGTTETVAPSCCQTPSAAPSCCTDMETCCQGSEVASGLAGACGSASVALNTGAAPVTTGTAEQP